MANSILKFPLKKDVFERVSVYKQDEVYFDNTEYWTKRFSSSYEKASFTCGKSVAIEFNIISITLGKGKPEWGAPENDVYIVKIELPTNNVESEIDIVPEGPAPEEKEEVVEKETTIEEEIKEIDKKSEIKIEKKNIIASTQKDSNIFENKKKMLSNKVADLIEQFCKAEDVITVGTPVVIVQAHGRILGNKKRLPLDNDVEIRFNIGSREIIYRDNMDDDSFISEVKRELKELLIGHYAFIWKKKCGVFSYPDGRLFCGLRISSKNKF